MNLSPIDPSRSPRHLMAAIRRWARSAGWRPTFNGWENPDQTVAIDPRDSEVRVCTREPGRGLWGMRYIQAASVREAVDLLVVYGYLPPLWSSAYALAVERYTEQVESLEEEIARKDRYLGMADDTIAGLMAENRELRSAAAIPQLSEPYPFPKITVAGGDAA